MFSDCVHHCSSFLGNARKRRRQTGCMRVVNEKLVWIETTQKSVLTAALEAGATSFLFQEAYKHKIEDWKSIAKFTSYIVNDNGDLFNGDSVAGSVVKVSSKSDLAAAERLATSDGYVIMDAADWKIIPAENLVATYQGQAAKLFGVAKTKQDAKVLLQALEIGTDGIVLRTDNPKEVREVLSFAKDCGLQRRQILELATGQVSKIQQVGMGDRVAVDFCSLLVPGEGLLVHAYTMVPGGKTAYLSELRSGDEVLIVDDQGRQRSAIVGRTKIESRPLVLVEATLEGQSYSTFLQNAETVRLIIRDDPTQPSLPIAVTELKVGDNILMYRLEGARHTGIAIQENILER